MWFSADVPTCARVFLQTVPMRLRGRARSRRRDHSPPPRREVPTPIPGQPTEGGETLQVASPASSWVERCNTHTRLSILHWNAFFIFIFSKMNYPTLFLSIAQFPTPPSCSTCTRLVMTLDPPTVNVSHRPNPFVLVLFLLKNKKTTC